MKEELSSEKMAEETKEAIDVYQGLTANDSNEDKMSLITSVYDEGSKRVVRVMDRSSHVRGKYMHTGPIPRHNRQF